MNRRGPETVKERCACGATFEFTGAYVAMMVARWRENHTCSLRPLRRGGS